MPLQQCLAFDTDGRGMTDITRAIAEVVEGAGVDSGLCHLFIQHTSASLIVCENADPDVRQDLERWMSQLVRDGDPQFRHQAEGPDDMPAHIRSVLTQTSLTVPLRHGKLALGTWQGIYLWEHRTGAFHRQVMITVVA